MAIYFNSFLSLPLFLSLGPRCFIVSSHANCSTEHQLWGPKRIKKKLISTFHSARKKYFVASSAFCGNAKFLQFCLLLLLKFFYIFEDRHINRGRIYASQPPQGGTEKIYPAFVSSSHTAKLYLFLYFEKKKQQKIEETDKRLRRKREDENGKKDSQAHNLRSSFLSIRFFLDKPFRSSIMDPPMNPHISINTLAKIKAYNNFINDEDQPGEEERKNFKEFQWKEII